MSGVFGILASVFAGLGMMAYALGINRAAIFAGAFAVLNSLWQINASIQASKKTEEEK